MPRMAYHILLFALGASGSAGCTNVEPASIKQLQALADKACACRQKPGNAANYDPGKPGTCWRDFDAALKSTDWAFMPAAADGPASSAAICVGAKGGPDSDADSCDPPNNVIWYNRSLGACSAAEEAEFTARFKACVAKAGDEIGCANGLRSTK